MTTATTTATTSIAIVGGSIAGVAAVDAARRAGYDGAIHLYDAQPQLPYDKPPLSKGILTGAQEIETLALKSAEQWTDLGVELRLGHPVLGIGAGTGAGLSVTTETGAQAYDGLVLTPGTQPRKAPFPIGPEVRSHVLRSTDDALALRAALRDAGTVLVVGGGFIGLEVAGAVTALGGRPIVVEAAPMPLARAVGEDVARFVVERHRAAGCEIRTGAQVLRIEQNALGQAEAHLGDGSVVTADLVVLSIGVDPAVDFLADSGLELEDGIRVDGFCETSIPRVYAGGDAANGYSFLVGRHLRIEHWTTAREQGAAAAMNLVADLAGHYRSPFLHVPYVWSDQLGMKVQTVGRLLDGATAEVEHRDAESLAVAFRLDGALVGGATVNRVRDLMRMRRSIDDTLRASALTGP